MLPRAGRAGKPLTFAGVQQGCRVTLARHRQIRLVIPSAHSIEECCLELAEQASASLCAALSFCTVAVLQSHGTQARAALFQQTTLSTHSVKEYYAQLAEQLRPARVSLACQALHSAKGTPGHSSTPQQAPAGAAASAACSSWTAVCGSLAPEAAAGAVAQLTAVLRWARSWARWTPTSASWQMQW